ncbi:MAG: hypothetical protein JWM00_639 [Candidatus Saccharibacteria bacterium]|nr:hypothetical protein [Candidatus Saccharibacteria bacterium]
MRIVRAVFWWTLLFITLLVLDDLIVGPIYWSLALVDRMLATVLAFCISLLVQLWLVREAIGERQSKPARWMLARLMIKRPNKEMAAREESLKRSVVSIAAAFVAALLFGGVITSILLNSRQVVGGAKFNVVSLAVCILYSIEFTLIHGGWGMGAVARSVVL